MKTGPLMYAICGLLILFLVSSQVLAADTPAIEWQKVLGGSGPDGGLDIRQTSDGGYILTGTTFSSSSGDVGANSGRMSIWVVRLDQAGTIMWQKVFGGNNNDEGPSIMQTRDGGFVLTGMTLSSGTPSDVWVIKLDPSGNIQWQKVFGGSAEDSGSDIQETADGGYILTGMTASKNSGDVGLNHGNWDVWVIKLKSTGDIQWQKLLGGSGYDEGKSIRQTADGGYILIGDTTSNNSGDVGVNHGDWDIWVIRLDSAGDIRWQKVLGGNARDAGTGIRQTSDGGYILTGDTASGSSGDVGENHGDRDVWIVKLDGAGTIQWQKVLGGSRDDGGSEIQETGNGGYILVGAAVSAGGGDVGTGHAGLDVWVIKLNSSGDIVWQKLLGGNGSDAGSGIQQTSDGGYILTGYTTSSRSGDVGSNHGDMDVWVVKLFPDEPLFPSQKVTTPLLPSVGQANQTSRMGFDGLIFNTDGKNTLDLDINKAQNAGAAVTVYNDRVEVYQRTQSGVLITFRGDSFIRTGDTISGNVRMADFVTDPVEAPLTPGTVSGSVHAILPSLTQPGMITTALDDQPDPNLTEQFRSVLTQHGLLMDTVAFTFDVRKENMPKTGEAIVSLVLPESWVNLHGGKDAVRIIRVSDATGVVELIPAIYKVTDAKGMMIFEGFSINGTSIFGLITAKLTKMIKMEDPDAEIILVSKPAMSTNIGMAGWWLSLIQEKPLILVIVIAVIAVVAYFGWWKRVL